MTKTKLLINLRKPRNNRPSFFYSIFSVGLQYAALVYRDKDILLGLYLPQANRQEIVSNILQLYPNAVENNNSTAIKTLANKIRDYFDGKPVAFKKLKLDLDSCTDFCRKIYLELQKIPHGKTISYGELASNIGQPGSARAVGRAVGANPLPLIIPCHRVIGHKGKIGGFSAAGGVPQKIAMLKLEGISLGDVDSNIDTLNQESIKKGTAFLCRVDTHFGEWIKKLPPFSIAENNSSSTFQTLVEAIVYQQLTGKAAATIFRRVLNLFGSTESVTPFDIIRARDAELRQTGLSGPKILAIRDLAEKTVAGQVPELEQIAKMSDEKIIDCLTRIRGIGRWTVEMLLIFRLARPDVLAADDYGLKKGLAILKNYQALPSSKQLAEEGKAWKPFRTIASWYLWRIAESQTMK